MSHPPYLLIGIVFHSNHLLKALNLSRLSSRCTLNASASQESRYRTTKLLRSGNCRKRRVLQLSIALFENGEGREQAGERRGSGLAEGASGIKLRAGSPQNGVPGDGNHGDNEIREYWVLRSPGCQRKIEFESRRSAVM